MATVNTDRSSAAYEMLLTCLCQFGQANVWGWHRPVVDPVRARIDVVTNSLVFGDKCIRRLARQLRKYVDLGRLRARLSPLLCSGHELDKVLHITASCVNISGSLGGKDIFIWDSGKGSRMGALLKGGKSKGEVTVCGNHKLYHFVAGASKWLIDTLRETGKEYVAFTASDQIVCLSRPVKNELSSLLELASSQDADVIFFDGPPELSVVRLRSLFDQTRQPRKNSLTALARDRMLLKHFGGGHIFQSVLIKKDLVDPLAKALKVILQAARDGYELDYGVYDVVVMSRLMQPKWLKQEHHPAAHKIYSTLCDLRAKVKHVFPISVPIQVFNVNTPLVLKRLRMRIRWDSQAGEY